VKFSHSRNHPRALLPYAAARRPRLVLVGAPCVRLAAGVTRHQHDRVEAAGQCINKEEHGKQEDKGQQETTLLLLRLHLHWDS